MNAPSSWVCVSIDGNPYQNFAQTNNVDGSYTATAITPGHTYYFALFYSGCTSALYGPIAVYASPPPTGEISASPPTCQIPYGGIRCTSTITWSSQNAASPTVCYNTGGGWNVFDTRPSGSADAWNVQYGFNYDFAIFDNGCASNNMRQVRVTANPPPTGTITANPPSCQVPAGQATCRTFISWNITNSTGNPYSIVCLQADNGWNGGANTVVYGGSSYSNAAIDLTPGTWTFRLYNNGDSGGCSQYLNQVVVTVTPAPTGNITASPNPCQIPWKGTNCTSTIDWTTQNAVNPTMCYSTGSGYQQLGTGASGSFNAWNIQYGTTYYFAIFNNGCANDNSELKRVIVTALPPAPDVPSVTISPNTITPDGVTTYTIKETVHDLVGGNDVAGVYSIINYQGLNSWSSNNYRGLIGWNVSGNPWGANSKDQVSCSSGGGVAMVYTGGYGPQYIDVLGCTTSVAAGSTDRVVNFTVKFSTQFATDGPNANNQLSGWSCNWTVCGDNWEPRDTFNLFFPGPVVTNTQIVPNQVAPGPNNTYGVTVTATDQVGGNHIRDEYFIINHQDANGAYGRTDWRGLVGFSADSTFVPWGGLGPAKPGSTVGCTFNGTPSGSAYIYNGYGQQYLTRIVSCTTNVVGTTRTVTFNIQFDIQFRDPVVNQLSGYAYNWSGSADGWKAFGTFNLVSPTPVVTGITIAPKPVFTNGTTTETITAVTTDPNGGGDVGAQYGIINLQDSAGNYGRTDYRGYIGWSATSGWGPSVPGGTPFPWWSVIGGYKSGYPINCIGAGGAVDGQAAVLNNYGPQFINIVPNGCTTSVSGNVRTTVFTVTFDPSYTGPPTGNILSGWVSDLEGNQTPNWIVGDNFNLGLDLKARFIKPFASTSYPVNSNATATVRVYNIGGTASAANTVLGLWPDGTSMPNCPGSAQNPPAGQSYTIPGGPINPGEVRDVTVSFNVGQNSGPFTANAYVIPNCGQPDTYWTNNRTDGAGTGEGDNPCPAGSTCGQGGFTYTVTAPPAFFQTKGSDIASLGSISTQVDISGLPGVYNSEYLAAAVGPVSNTIRSTSKINTYTGKFVPTGGVYSYMSERFLTAAKANNDCTLSDSITTALNYCSTGVTLNGPRSFSGNKVWFINGDLRVTGGNITVPGLTSSVAFIVNGDIRIDSGVTIADGLYIAKGSFTDISSGSSSSSAQQLVMHGAAYAGTMNLVRYLPDTNCGVADCNNTHTPAEQINYELKYLVGLNTVLGSPGVSWQEVAP